MLPWPELSFEVSLSVFVLYSVFYCSCLLVVFLAMSASGEALVSMPSLGGLGGFFFLRFALVFSLLALAGIPPLAGFFIKSFFFLLTLSKGAALGLFFTVFNLFSLYFYLSNTRLLILNSGRAKGAAFLSRSLCDPRAIRVSLFLLLFILLSPFFFDAALISLLSMLS